MAYFRDKFRSIFQVNDTPRRIAMAFAIGVFLGISPFLGIHYIGAFFLTWFFRLNRLVAVVGVSVNNPWTIVPISSFCVWVGAKLLGIKQVLPEVDWKNITLTHIIGKLADMDNLIELLNKLTPLIKAFFAGSLVICTFTAIASYFIIYNLVTRYKQARKCRIN
ncbi:MAG TPA: DUF2062 domain-containing protein [Nitrospirae bacterium]|nr:hypothetical protein BMS3Abin06_01748 [bacterium BMS3Abin06]HDH12957.1 DUF2062 domain-containing protein [Nitrospirota bacterium]HDZ00445.1 DUF2062 domain-containing protein [Nitrospirota bacterium]